MLMKKDIDASIPLVQELMDRGVVLVPTMGPLATLTNDSVVGFSHIAQTSNNGEVDWGYITNVISQVSASMGGDNEDRAFDMSTHDFKLDELAEMVAVGVGATLTKVKSVIIPTITQLEKAAQESVVNYEDRSIGRIVIEEVGINEVVDSDEVYKYFKKEAEGVTQFNKTVNIFPELDDVKISTLIETGSPDLTDHLIQTISSSSEGITLGSFLYNHTFSVKGGGLTLIDIRNYVRDMYSQEFADYAMMVVHFIANGLIESFPDGTNASITDIERYCTMIKRQTAEIVLSSLELRRRQYKEKVLLPFGYPSVDLKLAAITTTPKILVNRDVYHDFLAEGGSPDALIGAMVSDGTKTPALIIADREKYERKYRDFVNLNNSYINRSKADIYAQAIENEFRKMHAESEELRTNFPGSSGVFVRLTDNLKRMGSGNISTPQSLYQFISSLVCRTLYPDDPNIERVLNEIDNFNDGDCPIAQIVAFVGIDLTVDWLCDQIQINKSGV